MLLVSLWNPSGWRQVNELVPGDPGWLLSPGVNYDTVHRKEQKSKAEVPSHLIRGVGLGFRTRTGVAQAMGTSERTKAQEGRIHPRTNGKISYQI